MKKYKSRSGVVTVSRDAQCGLRAVRVGEASHPGPGSRIRRTQRLRALQRAMDRAEESDLETESLVSVDVAQAEHMVPSTVPASGVLRAEGPAEVIPMFDGSADGSEHEVDAAPVGRRRLVLVSQGSHVSQSGEGRLEDDRFHDDDSIDGVSVVSDVPVVPDVPSPLPIDLDPRRTMRLVFEEILEGHEVNSNTRMSRGWKLLMLLPRMLLHRPSRGGRISRKQLEERFRRFQEGEWLSLLREGQGCCSEARRRSVRRRRRIVDELEVKASRALHLCHLGEVVSSSGVGWSNSCPGRFGHVEGSDRPRPSSSIAEGPIESGSD